MAINLAHLRQLLLDRRRDLLAQQDMTVADRAPVTLDQESVGRISRIDAMQMQAMALAQERRRKAEGAAIAAALARMDAGVYGACSHCGDTIAPARLEHNPAVTSCIDCARG